MQQQPAPADLLALFTALLALAFSPSLSAALAPYVVITLGALVGAGWGLKRRDAAGRAGTWGFIVLMVGSALVVTLPAAAWLTQYLGAGSTGWTLAPLALLIGAVGEDWPRVGSWAANIGARVVSRRTGGDAQ